MARDPYLSLRSKDSPYPCTLVLWLLITSLAVASDQKNNTPDPLPLLFFAEASLVEAMGSPKEPSELSLFGIFSKILYRQLSVTHASESKSLQTETTTSVENMLDKIGRYKGGVRFCVSGSTEGEREIILEFTDEESSIPIRMALEQYERITASSSWGSHGDSAQKVTRRPVFWTTPGKGVLIGTGNRIHLSLLPPLEHLTTAPPVEEATLLPLPATTTCWQAILLPAGARILGWRKPSQSHLDPLLILRSAKHNGRWESTISIRNAISDDYLSLLPNNRPQFSHTTLMPADEVSSFTCINEPLDHLFEDISSSDLFKPGSTLSSRLPEWIQCFDSKAGFSFLELLCILGPEVSFFTAKSYDILMMDISNLKIFNDFVDTLTDRLEEDGLRKLLYGQHELYCLNIFNEMTLPSLYFTVLNRKTLVVTTSISELKTYLSRIEISDFSCLRETTILSEVIGANRNIGGLHLYNAGVKDSATIEQLSLILYGLSRGDPACPAAFAFWAETTGTTSRSLASISFGIEPNGLVVTMVSDHGILTEIIYGLTLFSNVLPTFFNSNSSGDLLPNSLPSDVIVTTPSPPIMDKGEEK